MNISKQRLEELLDIEKKLTALEKCCVDSWEWYGEAMKEYNKEKKKEEKIDRLFEEIQEALCSGSYDPGEIDFSRESVEEAKDLLKIYLKELDNN